MREDKNWPLLEKIAVSGQHNANTTKKVRHALKQIDRLLDVFEPGQLALSFNGGKDSTVILHLVKAACAEHATHRFSHVQPIWFQDPQHEFPAMVDYVKQSADRYFSDQDGLKTVYEGQLENLNRLWTMHIRSPQVRIPGISQDFCFIISRASKHSSAIHLQYRQDFIECMVNLASSTGIRCIIMGSRHALLSVACWVL
jgi:hypothetical protein